MISIFNYVLSDNHILYHHIKLRTIWRYRAGWFQCSWKELARIFDNGYIMVGCGICHNHLFLNDPTFSRLYANDFYHTKSILNNCSFFNFFSQSCATDLNKKFTLNLALQLCRLEWSTWILLSFYLKQIMISLITSFQSLAKDRTQKLVQNLFSSPY